MIEDSSTGAEQREAAAPAVPDVVREPAAVVAVSAARDEQPRDAAVASEQQTHEEVADKPADKPGKARTAPRRRNANKAKGAAKPGRAKKSDAVEPAVSDEPAASVTAPAEQAAPEGSPAPQEGTAEVPAQRDASDKPAVKRSRSRKPRGNASRAQGAKPAEAMAPFDEAAEAGTDRPGVSNTSSSDVPAVEETTSAAGQDTPAEKPAASGPKRRHIVDEFDIEKAGVEELREFALHRRRGRPSPQKEEARKTILEALENPTPESLKVARDAAVILRGAPARKRTRPSQAVDSAATSAAQPQVDAAADVKPVEQPQPVAPEAESPEVSPEPSSQQEGATEGYGSRRRRHDRRSDARADERPAQQQRPRDGRPSDEARPQRQGKQYGERPERAERPRDGKFDKKYGKNDRRERGNRREREYVTGPSLTLEEIASLAEEELLAKADELSVSHDGAAGPALVQAVYDELFRQEGFFAFTGVLELSNDGSGIVRTKGYLASDSDLFMPAALIRINGLRRGDMLSGTAKAARPGEKRPGVCKVSQVNGRNPEDLRQRPRFGDLTPVFPSEPLRMEHGRDSILGRVIDLVAPIGKGQRGLIVSPPKAGKTTVLKKIAESIAANNPEVHLICLLVDERPEEVTDMQRSIRGEVVASTFDMPCENHITVSELVIERAKRLVEQGEDVVILLDSITRLARAYNLAQPASGRILSGGVDSTALYPPKRFLGAARNIEDGGSLTILASALVDTGSKMDEVIFEEFKGTGNMELKLDRDLADRRVFPAVDPVSSGTRKEELLLDPASAPLVWGVRRVLANMNNNERAMNSLIKALRATANNEEFLLRAAKKAQGNDYVGDL